MGLWIASMLYLSSTNNNGDESIVVSSRLQGKLKLAFTWSLISLVWLLVIGPIIVGDLSMVVVFSYGAK